MIYILTFGEMVYIKRYKPWPKKGDIMKTAKLFVNGRSQAVRLPKDFRFEGKEVYIKKIDEGVILIPKNRSIWDVWEENLMKHKEPFMKERNQPKTQQHRDGLDEIFD